MIPFVASHTWRMTMQKVIRALDRCEQRDFFAERARPYAMMRQDFTQNVNVPLI